MWIGEIITQHMCKVASTTHHPLAHEKAAVWIVWNVCKCADTNVRKETFEECALHTECATLFKYFFADYAIVDAASSLASPTLWLARRVWRLSPHQSTAWYYTAGLHDIASPCIYRIEKHCIDLFAKAKGEGNDRNLWVSWANPCKGSNYLVSGECQGFSKLLGQEQNQEVLFLKKVRPLTL